MKKKRMINKKILAAFFLLTTSPAWAAYNCGQMSSIECTMVQEINKIRAQYRLAPLGLSNGCVAEAQEHAKDMDNKNYFSHDGLNEKWIDRMERFHLTGNNSVGENIAQGYDVPGAVRGWMNSPPHRKNILNPRYKTTGVGYSNKYWVQCFSGASEN